MPSHLSSPFQGRSLWLTSHAVPTEDHPRPLWTIFPPTVLIVSTRSQTTGTDNVARCVDDFCSSLSGLAVMGILPSTSKLTASLGHLLADHLRYRRILDDGGIKVFSSTRCEPGLS